MHTPYQNTPPNDSLTKAQKIHFYRQMARIRQFEQVALTNYKNGDIGGWLQLSVGQENVAVGTIPLLGENDHIVTSFRHLHHSLTIGIPMEAAMAELFGKTTGCCKGKGGATTFFAPENNHWGSYPIAGAQTPIGTGIAFGLKYKTINGCCLCYLGDGELAQGSVHESFNLAALYQLPIVYIIENNGYAFGLPTRKAIAFKENLAQRAESYGIAWDKFEDHNLYEIRTRTQAAINRARQQSLPTILEINTYRFYGFSIADANDCLYRTRKEIEERKANHDPIKTWHHQLVEVEKLTSAAELETIRREAREEAKAAIALAEPAPFPTVEESMQDIYSEPTTTGRHFFN